MANENQNPVKQTTKYKYLCPGCTNEAFYSNDKTSIPSVGVCPKCNKDLIPLDPEMFVELV